ncbi:hypothetical protein LZZ85_27910 [Terrimonas sp. NA20]|uniref:Uncharacterized protein n=1 Tax=Terrimonas ginsenosidimutans TaxID=2908004 RepID=A0ABS9L0R1_9BACT|nr:hypothetical protein [Terrimonas ginsenosidimutans]MCG2618158.1 hypothetical protein [Terrimonas ginsenosidimutans]
MIYRIDELKPKAWANEYLRYLDLRKKGLRKASFEALEQFILIYNDLDKTLRRLFIDFIYQIGREAGNCDEYIPVNLYSVFKMELNKWIKEEPENPIPYRWSSELSLVKRAVELDPSDQLTLDIFFSRLIKGIEMNQHEVEFGFAYDGDPMQDLQLIISVESYVVYLEDAKMKEEVKKSLLVLKNVASKAIR